MRISFHFLSFLLTFRFFLLWFPLQLAFPCNSQWIEVTTPQPRNAESSNQLAANKQRSCCGPQLRSTCRCHTRSENDEFLATTAMIPISNAISPVQFTAIWHHVTRRSAPAWTRFITTPLQTPPMSLALMASHLTASNKYFTS